MNDTETFQRQMVSLVAEADAFIEAGRRQQAAISRAYRALGIDLQNLPPLAGEDLSLDERMECEALVEAHIRHCQSSLRTRRFDAAEARAGHGQAETLAPPSPAGQHSRRSASRTCSFI